MPLVTEAFDWTHGTFMGATAGSETTAAAVGAVGQLRRDPMAMLPFCGYNMADYWAHWLSFDASARTRRSCRASTSSTGSARAPTGTFLWPGYGENSRVLKWIFERVEGKADGRGHAHRPAAGAGARWTSTGSGCARARMEELLGRGHRPAGSPSWPLIREHFARFGDRVPAALAARLDDLESRLQAEHRAWVPAGTATG